jgi:hypothetical protein
MKYEIPCLLLVGSTLVPYWHLTFLHVGFYFAVTWAVIHCRKQRNLSENQFAECKEYKPTLAYKCECRQKSLTLPNVGNICIHWILWDIYVQMICQKLWQISVRVGITRSKVIPEFHIRPIANPVTVTTRIDGQMVRRSRSAHKVVVGILLVFH